MDKDYTEQMAMVQKDHWWYEGRRAILASRIKGLGLSDPSHILEAGCGPGANLAMLSSFGNVSAFDPDQFSVNHAKAIATAKISQGTLPDNMSFDESFDLVCAFDVIEHIDDDVSSVRSLYERTNEGGYAVFTVPAFQFLWSWHDEINHHKRRYSKSMLRQALESAGYQVDFISYYNFWLFPVAAMARLISKIMPVKQTKGELRIPNAFINSLFKFIFSSEKHLLKIMPLPFGLSLIAVCKK